MSLVDEITQLAEAVGGAIKGLNFRHLVYGIVTNNAQTNGNNVAPGVDFSINTGSLQTNDGAICTVSSTGIRFSKTGLVIAGIGYFYTSSANNVMLSARPYVNAVLQNAPIITAGSPATVAPRPTGLSGCCPLVYSIASQDIIFKLLRQSAAGTATAPAGNNQFWCVGLLND